MIYIYCDCIYMHKVLSFPKELITNNSSCLYTAKMGPLPQGSRNVHIMASQGPDINMMKFYNTTNSTTYGRYYDKFKPRQGRHTGTGYLSNFRPAVYYNQRLDEVDNPVLR